MQNDPVLGTPDQPHTLHHYAYAFNNPVNYTDPAGLMPPQTGNGGSVLGQRVYPPSHSYNAATPGTQYGAGGNYTRQATVTARRMNALSPGGPARSANSGIPIVSVTAHNNYTRAQSQGQRPQNCNVGRASSNPLDMLFGFGLQDAKRSLIDQAEQLYRNPLGVAIDATYGLLDWTTHGHNYLFGGGLVNEIKNLTWEKALADLNLARRGGLGIAASVVIGATPLLGSLYDAASLQLGYDPITGITLTGFEKAAITAGLAAGLLGGLSFLDEAAEISAKMARHLDNIDVVDVAKAGRGLSHVDELAGAAKAGRIADELTDVAGLGRHADEALDAATSTRLRNLDAFTGGSQATRSADEVRASLRNQSGQGALSWRLNATRAWSEAGADVNNPAIRRAISKGRGPIRGGSGAPVRGSDGLGLLDGPIEGFGKIPVKGRTLPEGVVWANVHNIKQLHSLDAKKLEKVWEQFVDTGIVYDPKKAISLWIQKDGTIKVVGGHHRLALVKELNYDFIPARIILDDFSKNLSDEVIEIYGFRGTGRTAEEFIESDPLIYAGHIGISFDRGKTIYGFTPSAPGLSNSEAIEVLKQHKSFPGQVLDDTALFHRAQNLAEQGYRTQVYVQPVSVSKANFDRIKRQVLNELHSGPMPNKRYAFPGPEGCFNCATWPSSHGIPIPETTPPGQIRDYVEILKATGRPWIR